MKLRDVDKIKSSVYKSSHGLKLAFSKDFRNGKAN